jgi:hypothetical protein
MLANYKKGIYGVIGAAAVLLISGNTAATLVMPPSYGYAANYPARFSVYNNHVCAISSGNYDYWNTPLATDSSNHDVAAYQNATWVTGSGGSQLVVFNANGTVNDYTSYTQNSSIGTRTQPAGGSAMIQSYMGYSGGGDCVNTLTYTP